VGERFTWIPFYRELAESLVQWKGRQLELIDFLESMRAEGYPITPLKDQDESGERFLLKEIDPFTFFGVFNRGITNEHRIAILSRMKKYFNLKSAMPEDFAGIPILNNMKSWFFPYQKDRDIDDIPKLWRVFELALKDSPEKSDEFWKAFDEALKVRNTNINLTMGLFWIRPDTFINLDSSTREYLGIKLPPEGLNSKFYKNLLRDLTAKGKPFYELSVEAYELGDEDAVAAQASIVTSKDEINYWLVGAYWESMEPPDQTDRFLEEGIWQNGYTDRYLDEVRSMRVGDRIAIKSSFTARKNLPFDNRNRTVSCITIKARGTIIANRNDGRTVEVEWDSDFKEKTWYFFTNLSTIWRIKTDPHYKYREYSQRLIDFIWNDKSQDYDWFCEKWWESEPPNKPYSIDDIIAEGAFISKEELEMMLQRWLEKKCIILQGAPGVGKTFIARKLAYALMEEMDDDRIEMVQFHQSYSYDDFVRGYRPLPGKAGTFELQDGVFYRFCKRAQDDPDRRYVFIIDEINRGNLSQIFGELLMLIEHDKRGRDFSVQLVYSRKDEPRFYIPPNLYIAGLMNIADRSLAIVDYALRRRFVFLTLEPKYESKVFRKWLLDREMDENLVSLIIERMSELNKTISEDPLLGENYRIGHSFFCPKGDNFRKLDLNWYRSVVQTEIIPLLKEYWFDDIQKVKEAEENLLK